MDDSRTTTYKLPKGGEEFDRLNAQHQALSLMLGGLYPSEFRETIEKILKNSEAPKVLDVGCGSAIWSFEMARQFPQAQVVGVDLTPLGTEILPPNFNFRLHSLANGLPQEYKSTFDIIHCRFVCQHVPDPQRLMDSMAECLKPGGFLLIMDAEVTGCFDENKELLKPFAYDPSISITENMENKGGLSWHSGWWRSLTLAAESPGYRPAPVMIKQSKGLEELKSYQLWMPINWEERGLENGKEIGELMLQNWIGMLKVGYLVERQGEVPSEMVGHWRDAAMQELTTQRSYMNFRYTVASKHPVRN